MRQSLSQASIVENLLLLFNPRPASYHLLFSVLWLRMELKNFDKTLIDFSVVVRGRTDEC